MGIRGLQNYMQHCCPDGVMEEVSIRQLAKAHRSTSRFRFVTDPVLAVDGMSCIKQMYGQLCWIMSGQWREFVAELQYFVSCFRKAGIQLVFFFDGTTVGSKRKTWVKRRLASVEDVKNLFNFAADQGVERSFYFQLPASMGTLTRYALKYECKCDVRTTMRECDEEIAEFALSNNCFAVMANDSDFIVTNTVPYLFAYHLNLQKMTISMYNRDALAQHLKIRRDELPLLACLRGNDVILEDTLKRFHSEVCHLDARHSHELKVLLPRIAAYIRSHPCSSIDSCISTIGYTIFKSKQQIECLRKSLESYNAWNYWSSPSTSTSTSTASSSHGDVADERDWPSGEPPSGFIPKHDKRLMAVLKQAHVQCDNPGFYSILCGYEYDSSTALENPCVQDLPQCALLYRPLRQRTYSILLRNEPSSDSFLKTPAVNEWCVYAGNGLKQADVVEPIPLKLPGGGPTLEQLWAGEADKWSTFLACVSTTFNQEMVESVPPHFAVFCCIMNYIVQNTNVAAWEVEAFVAQAVHGFTQDLTLLRQIQLSRLDVRAMQLATIFMRGVTSVQMALGVCAHPVPFPSSMPWHFFDGKLFHECYRKAKAEAPPFVLCGNNPAVLEQFHQLMGIIVFNTRLSDWSFW